MCGRHPELSSGWLLPTLDLALTRINGQRQGQIKEAQTFTMELTPSQISKLIFRAPPFLPNDIPLWLNQLEAAFNFANFASDDDFKYNTIIVNLDRLALICVYDIVENPPVSGKYAALKERLLLRFSRLRQVRTAQVSETKSIADQRPSIILVELSKPPPSQHCDPCTPTSNSLQHLEQTDLPRDMNVTTTAPVTTVQNVEDTNSSSNFPSPSNSLSNSSSLDSSSFCSNLPSNTISCPPETVFSTPVHSDNPLPQQPPSHEEPLPQQPPSHEEPLPPSCEQKHLLFLEETNNAAATTPLHLQPAQTSVPQPPQQSLPPIESRVTTSPIPIAPPELAATTPIAEQPIVSLQASKMVATHYIRTTFEKDRCLPQAPKTRSQPNKAPYQEFPLRLHRIFKDPTGGGVVWRPHFASANWDKASKHIRAEKWRLHYASASTCFENTSLRMRGRHPELSSGWLLPTLDLALTRFKAAEIFWMLQKVYRDAVVGQRRVFEWYKRFKEGREETADNERSGRPSTSTTSEKVDKVLELDILGVRRLNAVLVPKDLTFDQKNARKETASLNLEATTDYPELLKRVITEDETLIYGSDSETTQQASEWRFKNEPRPKKARKAPSKVKVMLTVFFDYQGIVHHEFQRQFSTITADFYLVKLRACLFLDYVNLDYIDDNDANFDKVADLDQVKNNHLTRYVRYGKSNLRIIILALLLISGIESNPGPKATRQTTIETSMEKDLRELIAALTVKIDDWGSKIESRLSSIELGMQKFDSRVQQLESSLEDTTCAVASNAKKISEFERRIEFLEMKNREKNLVFYGIEGSGTETSNESYVKIKRLIKDNMQISEEIDVSKCWRLSKRDKAPILVEVSEHSERMKILKNSFKLKDINVFVNKDYSPSIREQRRILIYKRKELLNKGINAKLRDNKLIVNGTVYQASNGKITTKEGAEL
ncbi:hypothetical protein LAZ67_1006501 [Cordylochernes scorpioides]|uniref:DUF7041 domain-containing protein n=1 Tax=Cordylochernes scorpioides TaxID=51811 RepID=A0ABY6K0F9_9ARAC|nr:hypothetical protein LAZ67_1006501 [Cordylochernes scorpioides]